VAARKRVFVTGGTGFLGYRVVRALLEQDAEVTAVVKPGADDKLGTLRGRVEWIEGDVWNPASLRGRARGHAVAVHLVGGVKPDPARGLTFRHLNYVSTRNVAHIAVSDGVPHFVLLSASVAPLGVKGGYIESKRDAEEYLRTTGLTWTIVRAPALYAPGERRNPMYLLLSILGAVPLLNIILAAYRPLAVNTAARGIASLALSGDSIHDRMVRPRDLRRLGHAQERRLIPPTSARAPAVESDDSPDEPPFGWLP
jgi:nucleoside-diphosphate-sugar epimerase